MYKNKGLKRSYIFAYINVLFGLCIPVLLAVGVGAWLVAIMMILVAAELAALIVSHVFYTKKPDLYFYVGLGAVAGFDAITLISFIWESVLTGMSKSSNYAWMIIMFNLLSAALLTLFFFLDNYRKKKDKIDREKKSKEAQDLIKTN